MRLLLATSSPHKLREIRELLRDVPGIETVSLRDFPNIQMPDETGATMADNARLKAEHCARVTGLPSLADDSGIEVDALDGAPGVRSARWVEGSDADRTRALLERLRDVPGEGRTARYRCAICVALPDGNIIESEATCEGRITRAVRGANGFGYDPVFEITDQTGAPREWTGQTLAEAPPTIKARVSHRARALRALEPRLRALLAQSKKYSPPLA